MFGLITIQAYGFMNVLIVRRRHLTHRRLR